MPPQPEDYAIVVGISRYPALGDLEGPEWDARFFAGWLEEVDGGGLPPGHTQLILCPDPQQPDVLDAEPTAERVDRALERLHRLGAVQGGRAGRRLYLYFAGHGFSPDSDETALLMANADRLRTGHHIPGRTYADWVRKAGLFDEVVLFMDCCRDNYQTAPMHLPPFTPTAMPGGQTRQLYAFATEWSRKARESPDAAGRSRGIFSTALLAGLHGAAAQANGRLDASDLEAYVINAVRARLQGTEDDDQEPRFFYDKLHQVSFGARPATAFTLRVDCAVAEPVQLLDGKSLQAVAPALAGPPAWEWSVTTGIYKLERAGAPVQYVEITRDRRVEL